MEPHTLDLKLFVNDDLDGATDLFVRAFAEEPWNETWSTARARRRLSDILHAPGFLGVSAYRETALVGFAMGRIEPYRDQDHFCLHEMCVDPEAQRQGVGTRIMQQLHTILSANGCTQVYLLTAGDSSAEHFCGRNGYAPARRICVLVNRL